MNDLSRAIFHGAVGLGLFALVTAGVVALTHSMTEQRIAENRLASQYQALSEVLPDTLHDNELLDDTLVLPTAEALGQPDEFTAWQARRDGQMTAIILPVVARDGYSGAIELLVGITDEGRLSGVRVISHQETPGLGDKIEARKSDWIKQFAGLSLDDPSSEQWAVKKDGGVFDAFTGATITPRAVVGAVKRSLAYVEDNRETLGLPQGVAP